MSNKRNADFSQRLIDEKFFIEAEIGTGILHKVYRVRDINNDKLVAIKIFHPYVVTPKIASKKFPELMKTLIKVNHPNIVQIIDYKITQDNVGYAVVELVKGISLSEYLLIKPHIQVTEVVFIVKQIAAALAAAHFQNIIHKHLCPKQIHFSSLATDSSTNQAIKVGDFWQAKIVEFYNEEEFKRAGLSADLMVGGDPNYFSPEAIEAEEQDHRSDIYTLATIAYKMLAGKCPFTGSTPMATMIKKTKLPPTPIQQSNHTIPPQVAAVIMKALSTNPQDRQQSMLEFITEFSTAAENQ